MTNADRIPVLKGADGMTIEEAREYWCKRLERTEGYSDEHWDAEERHAGEPQEKLLKQQENN